MRNFDELLRESSAVHGHRCAGQVLGVRMAMVGCREVGIAEPKACKKLIVYVEMDRCATDAVQSVTGCSLGKRTLKFLDYGKMAVTFVNTETRKAVRVLARDRARSLVARYAADVTNPREAQKQAYTIMPEEELFSVQPASVEIAEEDMPGFRGARVDCDHCGEGINLRREIRVSGRTFCVPCARELCATRAAGPAVLLIVGFKKSGKTTLIERLVVELSTRGYRIGTIKRHHSDSAAVHDVPGTDSWRHRQAGANTVALVMPAEFAVFGAAGGEDPLERVLPAFQECDIVLVEGFHEQRRAKIEVLSAAGSRRLCAHDDHLIALVGNNGESDGLPCFAADSIGPLAGFIEREVLSSQKRTRPAGVSIQPPA
jgi:formylmethanofuran dehydrogenase subunit E